MVLSKDIAQKLEVTGYGGAIIRGKTPELTQSNGLRWGFGAGFPSHSPVRVTAEVDGEKPTNNTVTVSTPIVANDGSVTPATSNLQSLTAATLGLTWQLKGGFFLGAGLTWNVPTDNRNDFNTDTNKGGLCFSSCPIGDFVDYQFRIGYHPGVRVYVAPLAPQAPPPPPPALNRPPTVQARCEPCSVLVGGNVTVTADAQDPDGDTLRYRWSGPAGAFQNQTDRQTRWTAPQQVGSVPLTVTVDDGKGGTASAIDHDSSLPAPPPIVELSFEDVYFDFDRSTLRPEALRLLDDAVAKLQANPGRNIIIEGHTCNIGTAEYNLALGERRAESVRSYLTSRGVTAGRLEVRSYGEEPARSMTAKSLKPEETRRLELPAAAPEQRSTAKLELEIRN